MGIDFRHLSDWDREQLKFELAKKIGIKKYIGEDWGDVSSKRCGQLGRQMRDVVKKDKSL